MAGLGAERQGDRAGDGPGVPRSGVGEQGLPPVCLPACARAAPGPHALHVQTLLLYFIQVRRGALELAPGELCGLGLP